MKKAREKTVSVSEHQKRAFGRKPSEAKKQPDRAPPGGRPGQDGLSPRRPQR